jgi:hypothetical protein
MTDTPSIPPALTADEWRETLDPPAEESPLFDDEAERQEWIRERMAGRVAWHGDYKRLHKAAAMALYGQPFGFTHEDVRLLRESVERLESFHDDWCVFYCQCVGARNALAKIEALLPPR